ncbi:MFS transporter [Humibacter ginsenosidimutans]|uniref:MFS transporter n=1 Tax=Humibacter ginsenosidimutans TaxID=2599293 RepID=A0A5B8M4X0_9MICO|nr:MFS transporter [Humibacter ginsenosidimutans]QDZ15393.1 MFS transporter [Humibacter ginsenosidimutans]
MTEHPTGPGNDASAGTPHPSPASAATDAAADAAANETLQDAPVPRRKVLAWALYDWAGSSFNAVATTFVFTRYLTSSTFGDTDQLSGQLGLWLGLAGVLVALTAPITGQQSDATGHRKRWLGVWTGITAVSLLAMSFVFPDPTFVVLGFVALSIGTIASELANVNYYAMLTQVSTPKNVGRISGFGWGMGYVGGIVQLLILLFAFINPELQVGPFGYVQLSMMVATAWYVVFSLPVFFAVGENRQPRVGGVQRAGIIGAYAELGRSIARLWRRSRNTVWFLIASAVFRDGLTGIFTFGGVIASGTFGFSASLVIYFAVAANLVAGAATLISGTLDDRWGPRRLIITSLIGLLVSGIAAVALALGFFDPTAGAAHADGTPSGLAPSWIFWIFGLFLCLFVGPAQSASRSFLARIIPAGHEGEVFGLYATTGRAATFLSPLLFTAFIAIGGKQVWGIAGIMLVILVGLVLMLFVRAPQGDRIDLSR